MKKKSDIWLSFHFMGTVSLFGKLLTIKTIKKAREMRKNMFVT